MSCNINTPVPGTLMGLDEVHGPPHDVAGESVLLSPSKESPSLIAQICCHVPLAKPGCAGEQIIHEIGVRVRVLRETPCHYAEA